MFDRIAPTYDLLNRTLSFGIDRRWRDAALDALLTDLPTGPVLDLCAGTLDLTAALVRRAPERPLYALDLSREMLERGRSKLPARAAALTVGDATELPFAAGAFAGVIVGFGIRNVAVTLDALREVHRVLSPGGRFVTLELFRPTRWVTRVFHATYARGVLPSVGRLASRDQLAYRYLADSMAGFLPRSEYETLLQTAGFESVSGRDLLLGAASVVVGARGPKNKM